ncbi:putative GH43/DUF377 family glycosyl hydrolase [Paenibacillus mucilaginosus]|uniref:glycoside hydrolase family 130 protein n=1 Tax=Paenibacillus mucilaginosus TaxID=61624 RepID=UPI003D1D8E9F
MERTSLPFPIGPFSKFPRNPILLPQGSSWEAKDVFNPAAIVKDGLVYLLYRAEDHTGEGVWNGTSRIGLAWSRDGLTFERHPEPVLSPTEPYELPGGCEDPRISFVDGTYYLTYTAFDGITARLCLATSTDLFHWDKHGLLFPQFDDGETYQWTKSGAIVPAKVNGRYVMYFGDTDIWIAFSDDGIRWESEPEPVLRRSADPAAFDSHLIEPGPAPVLTEEGIVLLYNGARLITSEGGDRGKPYYSMGQAMFALDDPRRLLRRTTHSVFDPSTSDEVRGQIDFVVFGEGLVHHRGVWLLYYGMADSRVGVAAFSERGAEPFEALAGLR